MIDFREKDFLVFDFDDTLVVTSEYTHRKYSMAAASIGLEPVGYSEFANPPAISPATDRNPLKRHFIALHGLQHGEPLIQAYVQLPYTPFQKKPGIISASYRLAQRYGLGVVSNRPDDNLKRRVTEVGLIPPFSNVFGFVDGEPQKPDPRVFDKVVPKNIERSRCVYIGNNGEDLETARAAAMDFVGVLNGLKGPEYFIVLGVPKEDILDRIEYIADFILGPEV